MEQEKLKIGDEVVCSVHGKQKVIEIDDSIVQEGKGLLILYQLSCGCIFPAETNEIKNRNGRLNKYGMARRKGPYNNY